MEILKLGKYSAIKEDLKRKYNHMTEIINQINDTIPIIEDSCKTDGVNAYVSELKAIREDLRIKRDRIYNILLPEIDRKMEELMNS